MECPFCKGKMEKGFLQGGDILVWVKKKHFWSLLPRQEEVLLRRSYLTPCAMPAWICKNCEKIIADYSEDKKES